MIPFLKSLVWTKPTVKKQIKLEVFTNNTVKKIRYCNKLVHAGKMIADMTTLHMVLLILSSGGPGLTSSDEDL
jgi:hypothetical protein